MSVALRSARLKQAVEALKELYPLKYADNSWDNTGLLVDNSVDIETDAFTPTSAGTYDLKILLTVDLTQEVAREAIATGTNLIVSYHPFLFRKFNRIDKTDPQQQSLLALCRNGISVYSPHTAVDAASNGVNNWLADVATGDSTRVSLEPIIPDPSGAIGVGMGRILRLNKAEQLFTIVERVKKGLEVSHVQVAAPKGKIEVRTIGVCAGSGGSVFTRDLVKDCDLLITGELSHHELLAHSQRGCAVILAGHCNTERGYLFQMKMFIQGSLPDATVEISKADRSPFVTM
ncbi:hypothetical protein CANINC_000690 [Pichia inconspicua]|uniref:YbgI/family dinuclear metal center protein n=1 Tax=Pichia inconspicua TaxID=52247 RepID=A0A4T0X7D2_9ASCO|nr:hypothetical protein CANINC_000690 [[Candida] inconspicua]